MMRMRIGLIRFRWGLGSGWASIVKSSIHSRASVHFHCCLYFCNNTTGIDRNYNRRRTPLETI